jgi:hypothetical protein
MALLRVRRAPHLLCAAAGVVLGLPGAALAGKNDLKLVNLCITPTSQGCTFVSRNADGTISNTTPDAAGQSAFRSLMSELGVVVAPTLQTPADTLGYAGFQFAATLAFTQISAEQSFWNGVEGVNPQNPNAQRPDKYLTTVGGIVRKGLWFPLPAFEFGAGANNILGSHMYTLQGYAKIALQEGFHGWALPSLAARGSVSQLLGTDQVDMTVWGLDVLISKALSLAGTARVEPFLGWNFLFIDARSGVIDGTPGCDAVAVRNAAPGDPAPSSQCQASQNGTWNDLLGNFAFPRQDIITRQRAFGGIKLKLAVLFLVGEYEYTLKGTSHDESQASGARDGSAAQQSFSLSGGFDF